MADRKRSKTFSPGNSDEHGGYIVGKNKPPVHSRFQKGDGRKRGRRPKGTCNLASDLREELEAKVEVSVGGVRKSVSRQRSVIMRLADNASRGQNTAISLLLQCQQRFVEPLIQEELKRTAQKNKPDYGKLTFTELKVLEYIMTKSCGSESDVRLDPALKALLAVERTSTYFVPKEG